MKKEVVKIDDIQSKIYTIRGLQVMLDSDLAKMYDVETKVLNQAVKRNIDRFPEKFCFKITHKEYASLRSQFVTLESNSPKSMEKNSSKKGRHSKFEPFVFTEQGVAMLSAVLRSKMAIKASIQIMEAFVAMRKFINQNAEIFYQINSVERKLNEYKTETDGKIEKVLSAIESKQIQPKQGIFFNGQVFDAYKFVSDLVRSAKKSITLIDNYVDDTVLTLFSKRKKGVCLKVLTKDVRKQLELDVKKFNTQFPPVEIKEFKDSHDRFLIIDSKEIYHIGASLKDLGKKWVVFSKMNIKTVQMLTERLYSKV